MELTGFSDCDLSSELCIIAPNGRCSNTTLAGLVLPDDEGDCYIPGLSFRGSEFIGVSISCRMTDVDLRDTLFTNSNLSGSSISGDFSNAVFEGTLFSGGIDWAGDFSNSNLGGIEAPGGSLTPSVATGADFSNISLRNGSLRGVLAGADLSRANLQGATLQGNYNGANLQGVNLSDAFVLSADFSNANLNFLIVDNRTDFHAASITWSNTTCPDGTNSDDSGGSCCNALRDVAGVIVCD